MCTHASRQGTKRSHFGNDIIEACRQPGSCCRAVHFGAIFAFRAAHRKRQMAQNAQRPSRGAWALAGGSGVRPSHAAGDSGTKVFSSPPVAPVRKFIPPWIRGISQPVRRVSRSASCSCCRAGRILAIRRMEQDAPGLKIISIGCLLERLAPGEKLRVVEHLYTSGENVAGAAHRRHDGTTPATSDGFRPRFVEPEDAKTATGS